MILLKKVASDELFVAKTDHYNTIAKLENLADLVRFIKTCPEEAIRFHLRNGKNDFARWIQDSIYEYELARQIFNIEFRDVAHYRKKFIDTVLSYAEHCSDPTARDITKQLKDRLSHLESLVRHDASILEQVQNMIGCIKHEADRNNKLKEKISDIEKRINDNLHSATKSFMDLRQKLSDVMKTVSTLSSRISRNEDDIADVKVTISEFSEKINKIADEMEKIAEIQNELRLIKEKISKLEKNLNQHIYNEEEGSSPIIPIRKTPF